MRKYLLLILILIVLKPSCTNYDYGPSISLRSATSRISGEWELEKILLNDSENILLFEREKHYYFKFDKDGLASKYKKSDGTVEDTFKGTWYFEEDEQILIIDLETDARIAVSTFKFEILRLSRNELWVLESSIEKSGDVVIERRFKKI